MDAKLVSNEKLEELYQKLLKDVQGTYVFEAESGCHLKLPFTAIGYKWYNLEPRPKVEHFISGTVVKIRSDLDWIKTVLFRATAIGITEVILSEDEVYKYSRIISELDKAGVV